MTQARKHIVSVDHAGTYHCISRCVRRSWLCGFDVYSQTCFEHRKVWVERRIADIAEIFACSVLAYAVMSNHFHLVVSMQPACARDWSALEVATRWCKLFPKKKPAQQDENIARITDSEVLVAKYRSYLYDLSWVSDDVLAPLAPGGANARGQEAEGRLAW